MNLNYTKELDDHFKDQLENEKLIDYFRNHWVYIIFEILIAVFISLFSLSFLYIILHGGFITVLDTETKKYIGSIIIIFLSVTNQYAFLKIFKYYMKKVIITNMRIINFEKSVFFDNSKDALFLNHIQDVEMKQNGFVESLFDYGEIKVKTSSGDKVIHIKCVPHPDYYYHLINQVRKNVFNK